MTMTAKMPPPGQYVALNLRTKSEEGSDTLVITGVANDANSTDSYGTRIKVTQKALDGFMLNPVLLFNHDVHNPIGTVRSIGYVNGQLRAEAEIHPDARTNTGASISDLVRSGVLRAFSVRIDECSETRQKDYTQLDADVLDELSIVTLPSNRPSLFQMRAKGIELHGVEELELLPAEPAKVPDLRKVSATRAAGPLSLQLLTQRLGALISETKSDNDWYSTAYLVAVHDDFCVWSEYGEGTFYQQGYTVDAAGIVTLTGTELEVLPAWTVVGGADIEDAQRAISEADMGAVVGEVLLRVRTQLGLDFQGEPVLHDEAILRAVREATAPEEPAATPHPVTPEPDAPVAVTIDEVRAKIRMALQVQ